MKDVTADDVETKTQFVGRHLYAKVLANRGLEFIDDVKALWRYLRDRPTKTHLLLGIAALVYFISPLDAIPDTIPGIGYVDDAVVIAAAISSIGMALDAYRKPSRKTGKQKRVCRGLHRVL